MSPPPAPSPPKNKTSPSIRGAVVGPMLRRPEPRECRGRRSKTRKKGKLLGGAGVELAPELLGQGKKDAVENAEAVDAGMAGRDEEFLPRDSRPAVMNVAQNAAIVAWCAKTLREQQNGVPAESVCDLCGVVTFRVQISQA
jgi:hypothetical protein